MIVDAKINIIVIMQLC